MVFLDELTQGLDPLARRATWELVRRLREGGTTVILVSHHTGEVEALCDRDAILDGGRIVRTGAVAEVIAAHGAPTRVRFSSDATGLVEGLRDVPGVESVTTDARAGAAGYRITGRGAVAVRVAAHLAGLGRHPTDFRVDPPTLEDVLIDIAHHGRHAA